VSLPKTDSNVELARAVYRALADRGPTDELIHADAEYVNPPYAVEPGTRPWSVALERLLDIYPDFTLEPEEYLPVGDDRVLVVVRARATGASGVTTDQRLAHVWTIRDGLIARLQWYNDLAEARTALGPG
jgi:ketosteroid isomerase-like protein